MWNTVTIGSGNKGNSACLVWYVQGAHSVSHNSNSYWVSDAYLGAGLTIFKDTDEGRRLGELIKADINSDTQEFLDKVLLDNIAAPDLKVLIDRAIEAARRRGHRERAAKIRKALGLG